MSTLNLRLPEQNSVTLVGRLTHDPEVRFTTKGLAVCRFSIAVNRRYKDQAGNWQDDPSFIPVVVWGDSANRCGERLKKGSPVHVEGRLQSRAWETKEGQKRTSLEVISRRVQILMRAAAEGDTDAQEDAPVATGAASVVPETPSEDDIPF